MSLRDKKVTATYRIFDRWLVKAVRSNLTQHQFFEPNAENTFPDVAYTAMYTVVKKQL